ncbi:MAG: acetyl-CoA C-acyltransferase [Arenicellales bacterium]|jgi:acetyl-CoA C-acetyltransferase|nr:acetyl-CoA C-acyltransferase [Arenicellales bacterium]MDP6790463.1 acetyl-CoA C-acyltransferase [Arenicellales bacterium]MDP6917702.1 acetyl-CoA C-acyltransferase [Arenicellales bacterium]|tara:strand:- start:50336 stop:51526 length:1191 start_codon:yes stop_codon:yes gene_type:complete
MMQDDPIVITGAARTPIGSFQGSLAPVSAPELGAAAVAAALERSAVTPESIDEVIMGCVLPAGLRQAPARQAALGAGLPLATPCTTVNKMCGSGMKTTMLAHDHILAGSGRIVMAGGLESMSNAPYLLPKARGGYRLGNGELLDHMFVDGVEDAYEPGKLMGHFAEDCAQRYGFSREDQDDFAIESLTRATEAIENGAFRDEIISVAVNTRKETVTVDTDEQPLTANIEKIPYLKPAFQKDGTVTPANSSSISDGAAALVMMRLSDAEKGGHVPLARVLGHASFAQEPGWFTTAPVFAIRKLLESLQWDVSMVDLFEVNEAFAVVAMAAMKDLGIPHEKLNVHGGACALGHPVGASGARIIVTLLHALERYGLKRGVASLCIGGGEATAMAFERIR